MESFSGMPLGANNTCIWKYCHDYGTKCLILARGLESGRRQSPRYLNWGSKGKMKEDLIRQTF